MSSTFQVRRLVRMLLVGVTGLGSTGALFWTPSPAVACASASAQDPYGQDDGSGLGGMPLGDDGMPLPANRRRLKAVRKKTTATEKSKKADSSAGKDKSAAKKAAAPDASGKLRFSQDIAPILVANCTGCHSGDGNGLRRGKLDLSTFASMQTGTPDHKVLQPGKPEESTLVRRIKGEDEPRMPQGATAALAAAAIAKIERWVKEGATLDKGHDPKKPIASYAASADQVRRAEVAQMPVGERDKKTEEVGMQRFKQANPNLKPEVVRTDHFMMFGNLPKDRSTNMLKGLETQLGHLKRMLGTTTIDSPEKISIYAFSTRKDFVEFIRTVEARADVDAEESASARMSVAQPYVAIVDPQGGRKDDAGAGGGGARRSRAAGGVTRRGRMGAPPIAACKGC